MEKHEEVFELVDENDNVIGTEVRGIVHRKGLLHRAVYCWVYDSQGRLLLQRRSPLKSIGPNQWDLSIAEHLQPGETYKEAAIRGLQEELGITAHASNIQGPLQPTHRRELHQGEFHDCELVQSYCYDGFDGVVSFDDGEVVQVQWVAVDELQMKVEEAPETFTEWFRCEAAALGLIKQIEPAL